MEDSEAGNGGALGEGSSGSARMPGESMDAYIARLTAMGLFGGDITNQPQIPGGNTSGSTTSIYGNITPGTSSGVGALGGGTTSGAGAGGGRGGGAGGVWEPNNSSSGSSLPMPAASGGMTIAPQKTHSLAELLKGGGNGSAVPMKRGVIDRGTGVFDDPIGESFAPNRGRNALSDLLEKLQYVQPAYRNMPNPFAVDPSTYANGVGGRNYLEQLMRSRGGR